MSFGRNPHVAKAEAAELKADAADDERARVQARRDAAHQWDRAAEREKPGKVRTAYEANAARNRELADAPTSPPAGREDLRRRILAIEGKPGEGEPPTEE